MSDRAPDTPRHPKRIETQIHRRRKAAALSPLMDEWDRSVPPPTHLRMPRKGRPGDPPQEEPIPLE
jgi:hypothetical protein